MHINCFSRSHHVIVRTCHLSQEYKVKGKESPHNRKKSRGQHDSGKAPRWGWEWSKRGDCSRLRPLTLSRLRVLIYKQRQLDLRVSKVLSPFSVLWYKEIWRLLLFASILSLPLCISIRISPEDDIWEHGTSLPLSFCEVRMMPSVFIMPVRTRYHCICSTGQCILCSYLKNNTENLWNHLGCISKGKWGLDGNVRKW